MEVGGGEIERKTNGWGLTTDPIEIGTELAMNHTKVVPYIHATIQRVRQIGM